MEVECFTWIAQLLGRLVHKLSHSDDEYVEGLVMHLPECLIIDILSRLPADWLVRFQRNCEVSKALISSRYFSTLHLRRARTLLIIQCRWLFAIDEQKLIVFDERLNKMMSRKVPLKQGTEYTAAMLRYSCEGVLLFTAESSPATHIIFNPITREELTLQHPHDRFLCAFYYCSLTRQFKLVYAREKGSSCQYFIYSVKKQTWREIHCPNPNLLPHRYDPPAIVNGAVHLLVDRDLEKPDTPPSCGKGIMVLNMDKEELSIMPHPGTDHVQAMSLLVKDDSLSFCQAFIVENAIDIWILEDYEKWLWTKRCKVNLVFYNQRIRRNVWLVQIKPLHFLDGELVFSWCETGLFMYNMDHNTFRNIQRRVALYRFICLPYKESLLTIT